MREEKEHSKRYTSKSNTFSNSNVWNKDGFVSRSEAKGKFVVAKRMEAESPNTKKNEASKEVKKKSSYTQCWKCKGFGHMSKDCVNKKVMVIKKWDN